MRSWKKILPDYTIYRWDENTFDVNSNPFTSAAYSAKKYAFVADYVRLYALKKYGGIYLDTDVEIVKPFDELLQFDAFGGFETPNIMQTGVLAVGTENIIFNEFFDIYQHIPYEVDDNGNNKTLPNSAYLAQVLKNHGMRTDNTRQTIEGMEIFPQEYFCPIDQATREIIVTPNTFTIHYLSGSWFNPKQRLLNKIKTWIGNTMGYNIIRIARKISRRKI